MRIAILIFAAASTLCAQSFEVASVKINKSGDGNASIPIFSNGKVTSTNSAMRWILEAAWGFNALQISGPAWIDTDRFDIEAQAPQGASQAEMRSMLQTLLKERFHLTAHLEKREMAVYNLVLGKEGLKIKLWDPSGPPPRIPRMPGAYSMMSGPMTMEQLANRLTNPAGRPVVNKVSIEGTYFCSVQFSPLGTASNADQAPDIFTAVEQQLGLKLEPARADLDALVIDRLERIPTEN